MNYIDLNIQNRCENRLFFISTYKPNFFFELLSIIFIFSKVEDSNGCYK